MRQNKRKETYERKIRATKRTLAACDEALNNLSDEELLQKLEKISATIQAS